ncbi:hypothetical protein TNCV_4293501 [Trichonephila clavipes]|uniref:Uncharacterized protein n=1 Tax=Trichonephila clavipes TaxID=2585209 RepID=A0A8X6RPW6_TRICX|nr:hypothetical protein TNCV_4293501 [Trichonephila clavipes]
MVMMEETQNKMCGLCCARDRDGLTAMELFFCFSMNEMLRWIPVYLGMGNCLGEVHFVLRVAEKCEKGSKFETCAV